MNSIIIPCYNGNYDIKPSLLYESQYSNSSLIVYLDKDYHDEKEEIRSRSYDQQQLYNYHSLQRWKECSHTGDGVSYRAQRMRPLLAYHLEYGSYNMSWLWQHDRKEQEIQTINQLKDQIANANANTNKRLTKYELQLVVRSKED